MLHSIRRTLAVYSTFALMVPKMLTAQWLWIWTELLSQLVMMTLWWFFWRAIYSGGIQPGDLSLQQMLNYVLLSQILAPLVQSRFIFAMGAMLRDGRLAVELLRPTDFQGRFFVENLTELAAALVLKLPLLAVGSLVFGLQLPSEPAVWGIFLLSLLLGRSILFFFSWTFACLAFYSNETWGLNVVYDSLAIFASGALVPLVLMPDWLQQLAYALPFAQALYVPASLLSDITALNEAPRLLLIQLAWFAGLLVLSRLVFRVAIGKVTIQGG